MLLHANRQGLDPAEGEPAVERARHGTQGVLGELELLVEVVSVHHKRSAEKVRVTRDVLRRAVNREVNAKRQRILERRGCERVVAHAERVVRLRDHRELSQVHDLHQRVRRRLHPQHPRFRAERVLGIHQVAQVDERRLDPVVVHNPCEHAVDAAIAVVRDDDVVALLEEGEGRRDRAHAARERKSVLCPFEGREAVLERVAGRVRPTRVGVFILFLPGVRGRHVDRGGDRTRTRIRFLSGVNHGGGKTHSIAGDGVAGPP